LTHPAAFSYFLATIICEDKLHSAWPIPVDFGTPAAGLLADWHEHASIVNCE